MSIVVTSVLALVAGCVIGVIGFLIAIGVETGIGLAAGLSAGMCETLRAAQDLDLLTDAQAGQVFERAADSLKTASGSDVTSLVGTIGDCDGVLSQLQDQASG